MQDATLPIASWFASAAPALAAVAAVFIAGALAYSATVWRDRRDELNELMIAARLIESEIDSAKMAIRQVIENDDLELPEALPAIGSFSDTWEQHRGVLASHLTREQWDALELAVRALESAVYLPTPVVAHDTTFADIAEALDSASTVLEGYGTQAGRWDNPGRKKNVAQIPMISGMVTGAEPSPVAALPPVTTAPDGGATPPAGSAPPTGPAPPTAVRPLAAGASTVGAAPPIAPVTEPSLETSLETFPPYLLGIGAAAVLSVVVVVGVLVADGHTTAPDALRDVGRRAQQTVLTTTDRVRNSDVVSWQTPWRSTGQPSGRRRLPPVGTWQPSLKGLIARGR